ncbi:PAS domain S-box protein [Antarcticibacterium sp. 1MA-6-2]|uniref:PAS domain-containing sensor histidine kinase n=1 Tax=Antarcticibacterium sp. 1MA-6-2 TaxID=2908210 RepID=UPI001F476724|nr:PAS domain-containing sensor histidine kinase [Antarcticibacterium sp. 1MA-6-2]UJH91041.1 PAS domain S-box protein [Antarcticibacterium sp. 1MA-6-2]
MEKTSLEPDSSIVFKPVLKANAEAILKVAQGSLLVLDRELRIISGNKDFYIHSHLSPKVIEKQFLRDVFTYEMGFEQLLHTIITGKKQSDSSTIILNNLSVKKQFDISIGRLDLEAGEILLLINFKNSSTGPLTGSKRTFTKGLNDILSHAPAAICTLRGPKHIFELANERYINLVGKTNILGKEVRQVLPEVENQSFFEILDKVYSTGNPFVGNEIPIKLDVGEEEPRLSYLDFVYHPTRSSGGEVDGIFVHAIDVTEQVLARKKVEESEKQLRTFINTAPVILWLTNKDGYSPFLNKNWMDYTGQSEQQVKNYGWLDAIHPNDKERAETSFIEANRNRQSYRTTYRLLTKAGNYRWMIARGVPNYTSDGTYKGMIGTVVDVHEDKIKEQLLREKEHRIRSIVEEATVATALYTGREMKIELANDAMIQLWGKDRSVVGKTLREALPELEGQPFYGLLDKVFTTGETYWGKEDRVELNIENELKSGYFSFTYKPLRNEKGQIYGILNMALDVSEMVESKNLLKESESRFRQMADLMPEKVAKSDVNGEPIYFNQNWIQYSGLSFEELKIHGVMDLIHPEEKEEFVRRWNASLATGNRFEMEFRCRNAEGKYKWHLSRGEAMRNEDGIINRWIATTTEIQKIKEEEKRKEDFLKMVSHELKTPVTSIKGYVQLLLSLLNNSKTTDISSLPLKPSLERIDHQIVRLTRLISEMLDLSRLEENKLELRKETFNLNKLVDQTVQDITYTNTQHEIEVFHDFNCNIHADKDRIGQVLINFVTNAIKYSPENRKVEIYIREIEKGFVNVCVKDRGIGIEEKDHKRIFKRFYRVGTKSEETYSGFGIGLYLAKEIIHRHEGSITVKSKLGKGSEFGFNLSVAAKDQES